MVLALALGVPLNGRTSLAMRIRALGREFCARTRAGRVPIPLFLILSIFFNLLALSGFALFLFIVSNFYFALFFNSFFNFESLFIFRISYFEISPAFIFSSY